MVGDPPDLVRTERDLPAVGPVKDPGQVRSPHVGVIPPVLCVDRDVARFVGERLVRGVGDGRAQVLAESAEILLGPVLIFISPVLIGQRIHGGPDAVVAVALSGQSGDDLVGDHGSM